MLVPNLQTLQFNETADVFTMIYPEHEDIKPILTEKIKAQGDQQYRKTNVQADMTKWTMFQDEDFKKIIDFAIDVIKGGLVSIPSGEFYATDCWGAVYKKGDSCHPHAHHPAIWSFVYYVDAEPDDSPLVFPTSQNAIYPNCGLMIVFPGWVTHSVPPQEKEKERIVIAGNISIDRPQAISV
tara:strand:+ start:8201 stop:8746 length:546 start_codon:yes stop_codon:yes gene_type:complete